MTERNTNRHTDQALTPNEEFQPLCSAIYASRIAVSDRKLSSISPFLQLHLLVFLIASTAILGRLATVSASVLVSWRTLLAALGAFIWVAFVRKHKVWPGTRQVMVLLGIGAIIGVHWLCFFGSIKLANVSICLAGLATVSLFTAFTEPLLTRRRIQPFEVFLGLIVLAGIVLIAGFERGHLLGLGVALLGSLLAAIFSVLNRNVVTRGGDPLTMVGWEMVGAAIVCIATLPLFDSGGFPALFKETPLDWLWILLLAWVCTVFAHAFYIHLLRDLTAYTMNLAFNFEPIYGIAAAALMFKEYQNLHPAFYLGALAILAANLLHPWLEKKARNGVSPTAG